MASKKDDIVKKPEGARAAGEAAESQLSNEWSRVTDEIDGLDKAFGREELSQRENFMEVLRGKLRNGDTEVRVMQVGQDGRLVDVSDKVNARDLKPEDIGGIQSEDGKIMPIGRNPQTREAAMRLLQELLPGLNQSRGRQNRTPESIRRMESVLEESDKILQHWKK